MREFPHRSRSARFAGRQPLHNVGLNLHPALAARCRNGDIRLPLSLDSLPGQGLRLRRSITARHCPPMTTRKPCGSLPLATICRWRALMLRGCWGRNPDMRVGVLLVRAVCLSVGSVIRVIFPQPTTKY